MKKRDFYIALGVIALALLLTPMGKDLIAQTSYSVQGWLAHVTDETNDSLQVSIVSTDTDLTVGGDLAITGDSALTGNLALTGDATFSAWNKYNIVTTTAQSYSLASAGKAGVVIHTPGATASMHFMTDLLTSPGDGGIWTVKLGDGSDLVIDTEGSETIDGAATYTMDGALESATFTTDGTNFFILGSYLE